jgi:hypothetical protein
MLRTQNSYQASASLVISVWVVGTVIPRGESFNRGNPKTTDNAVKRVS